MRAQFAADVSAGLSAHPKYLPSKYFYDDDGSRLFSRIMGLPEYYLTRSETEIFETRAEEMFLAVTEGSRDLDVIELGAGDGTKTALLVGHFLKRGAGIRFTPIDISEAAVQALTRNFRERFPDLEINARTGDYFSILGSPASATGRRKLVLFLGSNIGNYSRDEALGFFGRLFGSMSPGDLLLTGFDLQKDPRVILKAYDDPQGVTAEFNLNLLRRINRELGGDFDLSRFSHYATYSPDDSAARSYLVSRADQQIFIGEIGETFHFAAWEPVFTEISQKYDRPMIEDFASGTGFRLVRNFFDSRGYFVDSLWAKPCGIPDPGSRDPD